MTEDLNTALVVLIIGIGSVFLVLSLVVLTGRLLIRAVNAYLPPPAMRPASPTATAAAIPPATVAAIVAAVQIITQGQGRVSSIQQRET